MVVEVVEVREAGHGCDLGPAADRLSTPG